MTILESERAIDRRTEMAAGMLFGLLYLTPRHITRTPEPARGRALRVGLPFYIQAFSQQIPTQSQC